MTLTNFVTLPGDDSGFPTDRPKYEIPDITSGLLLTYDADTLGDIGTNVTSWANSAGSTGSATDLTTTSTSKPTVVAGPNGHKAVRAVKGSSQYIRTGILGVPLTLPMTQVIVLKRNDVGAQTIISGNFATSSYFIGLNWATALGYGAGAGASGEMVNSYAANDTSGYHVLAIRHGASAKFSIDGVEVVGATGQAAPTLATLPRITLFANSAATSSFSSADIAFSRMFGREFTDADLASIVATLKTEYL